MGTAVHTPRVAAVGNFDNDDYPDIVIGNRLYLNREWVKHTNLNFRKPPSTQLADFHATGVSLTLDECKSAALHGALHRHRLRAPWNTMAAAGCWSPCPQTLPTPFSRTPAARGLVHAGAAGKV